MEEKLLNRTKFYGLYFVLILLLSVKCTYQKPDVQQNSDLLKDFISSFNIDDHPIYYQTISKGTISEYLDKGFSLEHVFLLGETPDSLKIYFNENVIKDLVDDVRKYNTMPITKELSGDHRVIREEEIPEFVKDITIPPPFNYSGFTNVYFLSTPIISDSRAIIFVDTYGPTTIGITLYFFVRDSEESDWNQIGGGSVQKLRYYPN